LLLLLKRPPFREREPIGFAQTACPETRVDRKLLGGYKEVFRRVDWGV